MHALLLAALRAAGELEWSRAGRRFQSRAGGKGLIAHHYHRHGSGLGRVRWVLERTFA
jgi:hypothetical protein